MENKLISIIIPIYNVQSYLKRCLDSVINQTYKNLEIILINDGSTDSSVQIAADYAAKDSRVKLITQPNGGLSNARNHGLKVATGEYISFIDSDDYVTPDYIEYLYNLLAKYNFKYKMSLCSLMNVYPESHKEINCGNNTEALLSGKECIKDMCYNYLVDTCAYAKLTKKELYDHVFFPDGKLFEDIATSYRLFEQCNYVSCGFEPKYYYIIRKNSIVTSKYSPKKLELLEMTDQMAANVLKKYPDLKEAVLRRQVYARFSTLNQTLDVNTPSIKKVRKNIIIFLKQHQKAIMNDPLAPKRDKLAYKMLNLSFHAYRLAWKAYLKIAK